MAGKEGEKHLKGKRGVAERKGGNCAKKVGSTEYLVYQKKCEIH